MTIPDVNVHALQYTLVPVRDSDMPGYERQWRHLLLQSNTSIFLSWEWIYCWQQQMRPELQLCTVTNRGDIIAMGFFVVTTVVRHGILRVQQLRLHTTGLPNQDQIWPEYNGMLVAEGNETLVYQGLVPFLEGSLVPWDELILGPLEKNELSRVNTSTTTVIDLWDAPTYSVDLALLRDLPGGQLPGRNLDYVASLSKNTRQQIRRSSRHYEMQGELRVTKAATEEDALLYFDAISPIHKERWGSDSGFYNPSFVSFHRQLIKQAFCSGAVELLKLSVGTVVLGYIYNFVFQNSVYFYLSGICPSEQNKLKPGLVFHSLCINHALSSGKDAYDFLGGEAQYKRSLANSSESLTMVALQKPIVKLHAEQKGRYIKHWVQRVLSSKDSYSAQNSQ